MATAIGVLHPWAGSGLGQTLRLGSHKAVKNEAREIFTARVRGLQAIHRKADLALIAWAAWSHEAGAIPGATNHVGKPSLWNFAAPGDPSDWAPDQQPQQPRLQTEVKPERRERELYDVKLAKKADAVIHDFDGFPAIWRKIAKVVYFHGGPEYDFPRNAKMADASFLEQFEAMLMHMERNA